MCVYACDKGRETDVDVCVSLCPASEIHQFVVWGFRHLIIRARVPLVIRFSRGDPLMCPTYSVLSAACFIQELYPALVFSKGATTGMPTARACVSWTSGPLIFQCSQFALP